MEYRSLGRTGVQVSPLCLGAMNFGDPTPEDESLRIVDAALDGGINFVDTANVYNDGESERIVGRALRENGRRIENELVPLAQRYGLGLLPWSPLAGGILAGRYNEGLQSAPAGSRLDRIGHDSPFAQRVTRRGIAVARGVAEIARERGLTAGQ